MKDLIKEYKEALEETKRSLAASTDEGEMKTYRSMISDLEYAIEWMETERQPSARRDMDRRSYYERTIFTTIEILDFLYSTYHVPEPDPLAVNENELDLLEYALSSLTDKEKEIYITVVGHNLSFSKCAALHGVAKGTIQKNIERARKKIAQKVAELKTGERGYADAG
ncbi:sigma factor-like helix-turn-helix DNA-binding protein [Bacillus safensis]|uniref:sigma factor-like helix-turn-helix DNA-binding protein n=1 Tax=Bacillus safensis TaxID=561879 RepID=UPI002DD43406|nr:sigma factor-like helix-turn-helix DNA-binding protein [Bacillus safensis]MEC4586497.1 sigma factor-like helix-turn-helix DNA-binding protein [Bacillus safensis]MEC4626311.1 sigma factor-like helix-turn-helix DNA-binding protein [Bacillus safensis]